MYQRKRMEKQTVKNIKIDRIKSEDIVADIKDTILHCQLFKVLPCLFFLTALTFLPSLTWNAPAKKQAAKNPPHFPSNCNKNPPSKCEINMTIKTFWFGNQHKVKFWINTYVVANRSTVLFPDFSFQSFLSNKTTFLTRLQLGCFELIRACKTWSSTLSRVSISAVEKCGTRTC